MSDLFHPSNTIASIRSDRRGVVMIVIIVFLAMSMTLFGLWAQSAVREHQRLAGHEYRMQAERLAESGIERARALHAANPQYADENWTIPATELGDKHLGEVRIRITPTAHTAQLRVEAVAEYPAGALRRAQVTKHLDIPNPTPGNES